MGVLWKIAKMTPSMDKEAIALLSQHALTFLSAGGVVTLWEWLELDNQELMTPQQVKSLSKETQERLQAMKNILQEAQQPPERDK